MRYTRATHAIEPCLDYHGCFPNTAAPVRTCLHASYVRRAWSHGSVAWLRCARSLDPITTEPLQFEDRLIGWTLMRPIDKCGNRGIGPVDGAHVAMRIFDVGAWRQVLFANSQRYMKASKASFAHRLPLKARPPRIKCPNSGGRCPNNALAGNRCCLTLVARSCDPHPTR